MTLTVLVVDDDPVMRTILRAMLTASGHAVEVAADGAEGLARLVHETTGAALPDVVIVDSRMPGIDGLEVVRRLRAHPGTRDLALVVMSAADTDADVAVGLEAGADRFLFKPVTPGRLVTVVQEAWAARTAGG